MRAQLIDLSVLITKDTPVYPGDPPPDIQPAGHIASDGYSDHVVSLGTHVGTHLDAPAHMLEGGKTLDHVPLDRLVGRGVCVPVKNGVFRVSDLEAADIQSDDIVLLHTGWGRHYHQEAYFTKFPTLPMECAEFFIKREVKMIGFDTCSPDVEPFDVHKALLRNNILILENLTNLDRLPSTNFEVYALPLNVGLDGAPTRVIAKTLE